MKFPVYAKYVTVLFGVLLFFITLYIGSTFFIPLFIGLLFSLLMLPFCIWLEKKGVGRSFASVLSIVVLIIALAAFIYFITLQIQNIAEQGDKIQEQVNQFIGQVKDFLQSELGIEQSKQKKYLEDFQKNGAGFLEGIMNFFPSFLVAILLIPLSMFFMLKFRGYYEEFLYKLYSEEKHERIKKGIIWEKDIVVKYLTGILTVVLILAIFNTIALSLFGLEHAIFFAVIAAFLNIIPVLGSILGSTLPVLYALIMKDSLLYPVGIALYFVFIQQVESYIITPNVVGNRVKINPYGIILAIFIGNEVWGPAGMVLFIPMLAILKVICKVVPELNPYFFLLSDPEAEKDTMLSRAFDKVKGFFKKR